MTQHPAIVQLLRVIDLASAADPDPALLAAEPGACVRGGRAGGLDLVRLAVDAGTGPSRAELERVLGPSSTVPRMPGASFAVVAFGRRGPVALFAYLDDVTGRAVELLVRRDAR